MNVEVRPTLGPGEIEIDQPLYGVILVGEGAPLMTLRVFDDRDKAAAHAKTFRAAAYVVRITGTNQ